VTVDIPLTTRPDTDAVLVCEESVLVDVKLPVEVPEAVDVPTEAPVEKALVDVAAADEKVVDVDAPEASAVKLDVAAVFPAVDTAVNVVEDVVRLGLPSPPPLPSPRLLYEREHFLTSSTAGWPLLSVMGVRVITHVSVN